MTYLEAILLGITQAITEFLPISSSAHLAIVSLLLPNLESQTSFDIVLHFGSLIAICIHFRTKITELVKTINCKENQIFLLKVLATSIPTLLIGLLFKSRLTSLGDNFLVMAFMLICIGIIMLLHKSIFRKTNRNIKKLKISQAIFIGLVQTLALIRGTSRSGITILAGLSQKMSFKESLEYSFFCSIPLLASLSLYQLVTYVFSKPDINDITINILGLISSLVFSLITIKFLSKLSKNSLVIFGIYRIILGLVIIIYLK
jgi:undecaprenyl-diphosphatase